MCVGICAGYVWVHECGYMYVGICIWVQGVGGGVDDTLYDDRMLTFA